MIETGILFGDVHSYYDMNLILSVADIPPAKPKTNYVDIPGGDGSVDLTEANGEVKFYDRECKFTFTMNPLDVMTWEEKKTEVSNIVNGRLLKITLDKDSNYYYSGRCVVDEYLSDKKLRQIVIVAQVKPYKFKQDLTSATVKLTSTQKVVTLKNGRKTVVPTFECTNDDTMVVLDGAVYSLSAGTHKVLDIQLKEGNNVLKLSGSGTVTISWQEGEL